MSKAYDKLAAHITREYEARGFSDKRARYIGRATAGEVAEEQAQDARAEKKGGGGDGGD